MCIVCWYTTTLTGTGTLYYCGQTVSTNQSRLRLPYQLADLGAFPVPQLPLCPSQPPGWRRQHHRTALEHLPLVGGPPKSEGGGARGGWKEEEMSVFIPAPTR